MSVQSFRNLTVWQKSFELAGRVYLSTEQLPKTEKFGMMSQIQRTAVSIPSNIAEGSSRNNRGEYLQFIGIARGSAAELETQLLLVQRIYNMDVTTELELLNEVQRMLTRLSQVLRKPRPVS